MDPTLLPVAGQSQARTVTVGRSLWRTATRRCPVTQPPPATAGHDRILLPLRCTAVCDISARSGDAGRRVASAALRRGTLRPPVRWLVTLPQCPSPPSPILSLLSFLAFAPCLFPLCLLCTAPVFGGVRLAAGDLAAAAPVGVVTVDPGAVHCFSSAGRSNGASSISSAAWFASARTSAGTTTRGGSSPCRPSSTAPSTRDTC